MEEISWLIGYTEDKREIRVFQNTANKEMERGTEDFTDLDHFQAYAALEAYSLYVTKKYPSDQSYLYKVTDGISFHYNQLGEYQLKVFKQRFSIVTSIDLSKFGREFLMEFLVI